MPRRVLDSVSLNVMKEYLDENELNFIRLNIGIGTEVSEPKTKQIKFNKSSDDLRPNTLSDTIKALSFNAYPTTDDCVIIDNNGTEHKVGRKTFSYIKTLVIYSVVCNKFLAECILKVLDEYSRYLSEGTYSVRSELVEGSNGRLIKNTKKSKLLEEVRKEFLSLLSEDGESIDVVYD